MLWLRSKVGPKGQAVIPKAAREVLNIGPGDELLFGIRDGELVVKKGGAETILDEFLNAVPKRRIPKDFDWDEEQFAQLRDRNALH